MLLWRTAAPEATALDKVAIAFGLEERPRASAFSRGSLAGLPLRDHGIKFWRTASHAACVRLCTPSFACAFLRWLRMVSSPRPRA